MKVTISASKLQARPLPCLCALPHAEAKAAAERRRPSQGAAGTHVHVVDAVPTYCSSVVTEVILNSWVPHLKFRREEGRLAPRNREGAVSGAQT